MNIKNMAYKALYAAMLVTATVGCKKDLGELRVGEYNIQNRMWDKYEAHGYSPQVPAITGDYLRGSYIRALYDIYQIRGTDKGLFFVDVPPYTKDLKDLATKIKDFPNFAVMRESGDNYTLELYSCFDGFGNPPAPYLVITQPSKEIKRLWKFLSREHKRGETGRPWGTEISPEGYNELSKWKAELRNRRAEKNQGRQEVEELSQIEKIIDGLMISMGGRMVLWPPQPEGEGFPLF